MCLLMPVLKPVEIVCKTAADRTAATFSFTPQNWMISQPVQNATADPVFVHRDWGKAAPEVVQAGVLPATGVAWFERPDLTSVATFEAKFGYSQQELSSAQVTAASLYPVARVCRVKTPVTVDGEVSDWAAGTGLPLTLRAAFGDDGLGPARGRAGLRWTGNELYVGVDIVADPTTLTREGGRWGGVMDGVEFDLQAEPGDQADAAALVLHGFPSGKLESVTDGGAAAALAAAFLEQCQFAARIHDTGWSCELRIALAGSAAAWDRRAFNIGARVGLGDSGEWIGWAKPRGPFYHVAHGGRLAVLPALSADSANLLDDGDFEVESSAHWRLSNNRGKTIEQHIAQRVREGVDGGWCMRLQCLDAELQKDAMLKWTQSVAGRVEPGIYVLAYDVRIDELKAQGADGMFCAYVHVRRGGKPGGNIGQREYAIRAAELPWTRRDCVLEIPAGVEPSMLSLQLHRATGVVWIDHVSLRRAAP